MSTMGYITAGFGEGLSTGFSQGFMTAQERKRREEERQRDREHQERTAIEREQRGIDLDTITNAVAFSFQDATEAENVAEAMTRFEKSMQPYSKQVQQSVHHEPISALIASTRTRIDHHYKTVRERTIREAKEQVNQFSTKLRMASNIEDIMNLAAEGIPALLEAQVGVRTAQRGISTAEDPRVGLGGIRVPEDEVERFAEKTQQLEAAVETEFDRIKDMNRLMSYFTSNLDREGERLGRAELVEKLTEIGIPNADVVAGSMLQAGRRMIFNHTAELAAIDSRAASVYISGLDPDLVAGGAGAAFSNLADIDDEAKTDQRTRVFQNEFQAALGHLMTTNDDAAIMAVGEKYANSPNKLLATTAQSILEADWGEIKTASEREGFLNQARTMLMNHHISLNSSPRAMLAGIHNLERTMKAMVTPEMRIEGIAGEFAREMQQLHLQGQDKQAENTMQETFLFRHALEADKQEMFTSEFLKHTGIDLSEEVDVRSTWSKFLEKLRILGRPLWSSPAIDPRASLEATREAIRHLGYEPEVELADVVNMMLFPFDALGRVMLGPLGVLDPIEEPTTFDYTARDFIPPIAKDATMSVVDFTKEYFERRKAWQKRMAERRRQQQQKVPRRLK
jgi:hypothetical protein